MMGRIFLRDFGARIMHVETGAEDWRYTHMMHTHTHGVELSF